MTENKIEPIIPKNNENFLDHFIPYAMYRITNRLNMELQSDLAPLKINVSRWRVLAALTAKDGRTMGELSQFTMMEQSSISRVVDRMVEEGLVIRQTQKQDNRYILVYMCEKGHEKFKTVFPKVIERQDRALKGFSKEECDILLGYMKRIEENITQPKTLL